MKLQWETVTNKFDAANDILADYCEGVTEKRHQKPLNKLIAAWDDLARSVDEYSKLVDYRKAVEIKMPFDSEKFAKAWEFFLDYLEESHRIYLGSRQQAINLAFVNRVAQKDENRAIALLEAHIRLNYKRIYPLSDNQISGDDTNLPDEKDNSGFDPSAPKKRI